MKRLWLITLLLVGCATALLWWNWAAAVELARRDIESDLARRFGQPASVRRLEISVLPPLARIEGVYVGADQPVLELDALSVRMAVLSTIAEARPVVTATVKSLFFDVTRLHADDEAAPQRFSPPAFRLGGLRADDTRVRFPIGDEVGELSVARAQAKVESSLLRMLVGAAVKLEACLLSRKDETLDLGEVLVTAEMDANGITIPSASLKGPNRTIDITGEGPDRHRVHLDLDVRDLAIIDDDFAAFSGKGRASGEIHGPLLKPILTGVIEIDELRAADRVLGKAEAGVHHEGTTTRFEDVVILDEAGSARGTVIVEFDGRVPVEATVDWDVGSVERLLNKVDLELELDSRLTGSTSVVGQFDPLDLRISGRGDLAADKERGALTIEARIAKNRTKIDYTLVQSGHTRIDGKLAVRDGSLDGRANIVTGDLSALSALAPRAVQTLELSGVAHGDVVVAGATNAPLIRGSVAAGPASAAAVRLERLRGSFSWTEPALELSSVELATEGGGEARLSGVMALAENVSNSWRLDLAGVDTDLAIGIWRRFANVPDTFEGGTLTGSVECAGPWEDLSFKSDLAATSLRVGGEPFAVVEMRGSRTPPTWHVDIDATHRSGLALQIAGGAANGTDAEVFVSATPFDLQTLDIAKRFDLSGSVTMRGHLTGKLAAPSGEFELSATELAIGDEAIGEVSVRAQGAHGKWQVDGQAPAKRLSASASAALSHPFPYEATIAWNDLAFDMRARGTDRLSGSTTGSTRLAGQIATWENSEVALRLAAAELQWGDARVTLETAVELSGRKGTFSITPFAVAGKDTELTVGGSIDRGNLTATVAGTVGLDYLELLGEPLVSASGRADVDMTLYFGRRGWEAVGTATLQPSVLDFGAGVAFADARGRLSARGRVFVIDELNAESGGGRVRLRGRLDLDSGPEVFWEANDVALSLRRGLEVVVTGTGSVAGTWDQLLVGGDVSIPNALYSQDFEIVDIPALFAPRVRKIEGVAPEPVTIRLDLKTRAQGGLYIDNNVAQVELWVDGTVKGTVREPQLVGTVGVVGGEVRVRRRRFELTGGAADFRGRVPPNPNLNITAETEVSTADADYLITVSVSGTARDPIVQFGSEDPTLTQTDILSLVAVGRTAAELQGESQGVSQIDALALVPTAPLEEQVSDLVGIDRFEIDLAQTNSQGDVSPGLTIGKDITDRFRGAVTTSFDVDARNAVVLEYDLTRRLSLVGQWEADAESQAGAFGAGVRMRYEFRRIPLSIFRSRPAPEPEPNAD